MFESPPLTSLYSSRRAISNLRLFASGRSVWPSIPGSERGPMMLSESLWVLAWTTIYRYHLICGAVMSMARKKLEIWAVLMGKMTFCNWRSFSPQSISHFTIVQTVWNWLALFLLKISYLSFVFFFQPGKWIHQRRVWTGTTYVGWFSHNEGHENLSLWEGMCLFICLSCDFSFFCLTRLCLCNAITSHLFQHLHNSAAFKARTKARSKFRDKRVDVGEF